MTSVTNPPEQGLGTASEASTGLRLIGEVHLRASSEPPLPRHLGHLGIPSRSPSSSPRPQGRESTSRTVFEWEQAQSRRAALYSEIPDRGRSHQDSSAVNALVFGQRRTRPGSVDPGLEEERIRPGSIMDQPQAAGMPVSVRFREGLRAVQRSLTPQPSNAVLMGEASAPSQSFVQKNAKRNVPQISKGDSGTVGEVVFGDAAKAPDHPEVLRIVWGGCAGQPSSREEGRKKATPPFATLWDLKGYAGYAGLVSQSSTLSSSLPASPISEASEPTRCAKFFPAEKDQFIDSSICYLCIHQIVVSWASKNHKDQRAICQIFVVHTDSYCALLGSHQAFGHSTDSGSFGEPLSDSGGELMRVPR